MGRVPTYFFLWPTHQMDPLVSIQLDRREPGEPTCYAPGMELHGQCQIDAVDPADVLAVELSVLWRTQGKGDEDIGVHYFQRRTPADVLGGDLCALWDFATTMPASPLSYEGRIVKIRWCVRVRVFLTKRRQVVYDEPLKLVKQVEPALEPALR